MEVSMVRRKVRVDKEITTAIRLSIPSELWRKFRAGCLYMDKDVNSELNRLLENWVKEWYKRITRSELPQVEVGMEQQGLEDSPFRAQAD
jgi:hypothetical protein